MVLLDAGADIEAVTEFGSTPLHLATKHSKIPEMISLLLDRGANSNAKNGHGETPFELAKENEYLKGSNAYWQLNERRSQ